MSNKNNNEGEALERGLKVRHINMIAIGGAIGTGLFVGTGGSLSEGGAGGIILAYCLVSVMIYFSMTSLGEMSTYMPVSGAFETYSTRFVSPSFGFAMGLNYWFNWAVTIACELEAATLVLRFWFPHANSLFWSLGFIIFLFLLNWFSVGSFGEAEFWFAGIKVVTIVVFLITGVLLIFGIMGGQASPGFSNWHVGNGAFPHGAWGCISVFLIAGFSFQGTELIGIMSGEAKDPEHAVPKAVKAIFYRILLFYIGSIIVISLLIPYTNPNLLNGGVENVSVSPFTLVFKRAGIAFAASLMNAVILTSVLSAGNSAIYAGSRTLYAMATEDKIPRAFAKTNKRGVPYVALIFTTVFGVLSFFGSFVGEGQLYLWMVNTIGISGFITWFGIGLDHYRFRRAFILQGHSTSELKYMAKGFPVGPMICMLMCAFVICGQFFAYGDYSIKGFMTAYIGLVLFIVLFVGWRLKHHDHMIPLKDIDLTPDTGNVKEKKAN